MTRNVVLIVLDSVRKDYFDRYAPRLQSLADRSYERCYAASSWSAPSHASMLTGALPHEHGIHIYNTDFGTIDERDTFLVDLPNHRTVGASTNLFAGSSFGFDRFFDEFSSFTRFGVLPGGVNIDEFARERGGDGVGRYYAFFRDAYRRGELLPSVVNGAFLKLNNAIDDLPVPRIGDYGAGALVREARRLVEREPFFLFMNFMDAHPPFQPSLAFDGSLYSAPNTWSSDDVDKWEINNADDLDPYAEYLDRYRELYGAAIDYLDRRVASFVADVQESTGGETTFLITADHGENLGLPGDGFLLGHVASLSDALLHVPMAVVNPPDGRRSADDSLVSHLDLRELIPAIAGDDSPDLSRTHVPAERVGIGLSQPDEDFDYWNRMLRSVHDRDTKYVWDSLGNRERYRLTPPSSEERTASDVDLPGWAIDLFDGDIREFKREASSSIRREDFDASTRERLEQLGYL